MELRDFSLGKLDRLLVAADREKARRATRKPRSSVARLLAAAAEELGYGIDEVFPEFFPRRRDATAEGAKALGDSPRAPAQTAIAHSRTRSPKAVPVASVVQRPEPEATARKIVESLQRRDAHSLHLSVPTEALVRELGLEDAWPRFYAGLEEANRRDWVHFRGNTHCVLTAQGNALRPTDPDA